MGDLIAQQAKIVLIVDPSGSLDFSGSYKRQSLLVSRESMFMTPDLDRYSGTIIATHSMTPERASSPIDSGLIDMGGFGRKFSLIPTIRNTRSINLLHNEISDTHTHFDGGDAGGYTDYPALHA